MISLIYTTNRINPRFEWFVDSLYSQIKEHDQISLVFVDAVLEKGNESERRNRLGEIIAERFLFTHVKPKDNIYQGAARKTKTEYFAASNSRNTGAALAGGEYIVFVDDLSILMPSWWNAVKQAADNNRIICGAYQKHSNCNVSHGTLLSSTCNPSDIDSRWNWGNDEKPVSIQGSSLAGCSFGIPKSIFNSVDGFDEICDSIGGEDYQLGIRLNNAGHDLYYDRRMFTVEAGDEHAQPYLMAREDRVLPSDQYMKRLEELSGINYRFKQGNWDSSHMILDILYGTRQVKSFGIRSDTEHWFDSRPLIEM